MQILDIFRREDDCISLSRIMCVIIFICWILATVLEFLQADFMHYEQLTIAMLVSMFGGLGNKYIESRFLCIRNEETIRNPRGETK